MIMRFSVFFLEIGFEDKYTLRSSCWKLAPALSQWASHLNTNFEDYYKVASSNWCACKTATVWNIRGSMSNETSTLRLDHLNNVVRMQFLVNRFVMEIKTNLFDHSTWDRWKFIDWNKQETDIRIERNMNLKLLFVYHLNNKLID